MLKKIVAVTGIFLLIIAFHLPAVQQPQSFHNFADKRYWYNIPNIGDVISNLAFLIVALYGLFVISKSDVFKASAKNLSRAYYCMFYGLLFTAIGSAFYHLSPCDKRLVCDRIPITLVFMPLLAATLIERLGLKGNQLLVLCICIGVSSVLYWMKSDNLMLYFVAQYGAIFLIILSMLLLPSPYSGRNYVFVATALYGVAFICERYDNTIFEFTNSLISGHTVKHLIAASAFLFIISMLKKQQYTPIDEPALAQKELEIES